MMKRESSYATVGGRPREEVEAAIRRVVEMALEEDVATGDLTTLATVGPEQGAVAEVRAREEVVVSGLDVAEAVFRAVWPAVRVEALVADGDRVGVVVGVMRVTGLAGSLLTAERCALNLLQRLSGVATLTRRYVEAVAGTGAVILDTRKTTPGLRLLEKRAVVHGGGKNHRFGLFDAILIKDNHLAALAGEVGDPLMVAVARVRERYPGWAVEVEADDLGQVRQAVAAGVEVVLLDNMSLVELREAVKVAGGRVRTEASGGVRLETVRAIAETGVEYISVGALTHGVPAVDLGLDWRLSG